jgi:hypothetical protein
MATDGPDPQPCDPRLYREGICVGVYGTAGANAFERLIGQVREASGRPVDWHYAAGRAVVLTFKDDAKHVTPHLQRIVGTSGTCLRPSPSEHKT